MVAFAGTSIWRVRAAGRHPGFFQTTRCTASAARHTLGHVRARTKSRSTMSRAEAPGAREASSTARVRSCPGAGRTAAPVRSPTSDGRRCCPKRGGPRWAERTGGRSVARTHPPGAFGTHDVRCGFRLGDPAVDRVERDRGSGLRSSLVMRPSVRRVLPSPFAFAAEELGPLTCSSRRPHRRRWSRHPARVLRLSNRAGGPSWRRVDARDPPSANSARTVRPRRREARPVGSSPSSDRSPSRRVSMPLTLTPCGRPGWRPRPSFPPALSTTPRARRPSSLLSACVRGAEDPRSKSSSE